jgi:ribosomal protein S26
MYIILTNGVLLRGKEPLVTCDNCGRKIPRSKAVVDEKVIRFDTETHSEGDVRFLEKRKVYYCISCAKHRGIFDKKRAIASRMRKF